MWFYLCLVFWANTNVENGTHFFLFPICWKHWTEKRKVLCELRASKKEKKNLYTYWKIDWELFLLLLLLIARLVCMNILQILRYFACLSFNNISVFFFAPERRREKRVFFFLIILIIKFCLINVNGMKSELWVNWNLTKWNEKICGAFNFFLANVRNEEKKNKNFKMQIISGKWVFFLKFITHS